MSTRTQSMIVAPQPEATEAGAVVLQRGGNAVDAAIACALVQTVVDPLMSGIAGFGSLQIYSADKGEHVFIDAHGRCPAAATPTMWADRILGETTDGFGFIPARLRQRARLRRRHRVRHPPSLLGGGGSVRHVGLADVVAPAIAEAERGLVVRPHVYTVWTQDERRFGRLNYGDKLGVVGNRAPRLPRRGRRLQAARASASRTRTWCARSSASRARAPTCSTAAPWRREIDADFRANGGLLNAADLAAYRTERQAPLWGEYRGHRIATNHPPGGGLLILEILRILEQFDVAAMGHNTPRHLAVLAEAMKCATRDKDMFISDPRFVDVPVDRLNSRAYGAEVAAAIRAGHRYDVPRLGGLGDAPQHHPRVLRGRQGQRGVAHPLARHPVRRHHARSRLHAQRLHVRVRPRVRAAPAPSPRARAASPPWRRPSCSRATGRS